MLILLLLACTVDSPDRASDVREICEWEKSDGVSLRDSGGAQGMPSLECVDEIDRDFEIAWEEFDITPEETLDFPMLSQSALWPLFSGVRSLLTLNAEGDSWIPGEAESIDVGSSSYNYIADRIDGVGSAVLEGSAAEAQPEEETISLNFEPSSGSLWAASFLIHEARHLDPGGHEHGPCDWDEEESCDRIGSVGAYGLQHRFLEKILPFASDDLTGETIEEWMAVTGERR